MQTSQQACTTCRGQKVTKSPDQSIWQRCPSCEGTGHNYDPGLIYKYRTVPITLTGNGTAVQIITFANYDFRYQMLTGESTGPFTFKFTDIGATRVFSNAQIHSAEALGTGTQPFPELVPFVFRALDQLQIDFTDVSGFSNTVALCLLGVNLGEAKQA